MKISPAVIIKLNAYSVKDTSEEADFFRCRTSRNIIGYMTARPSNRLDENEQRKFENLAEMSENIPSNLDYMNNRKGSAGSFNAKKHLNKQEVDNYKKALKNCKGYVWAAIVSFTPEAASQICRNRDMARELLCRHLDKLFTNTRISPDNIDWIASYHTNTDNPHIHLEFFEKKPTQLSSSGEKRYTSKFLIPKENLTDFKYGITQELRTFDYQFTKLRNPIRDSMQTNILNDKFHLKNLLNVGKPIIDEGYYQYERLSDDNKKLATSLVQYFLRNFPETMDLYKKYDEALIDRQAEFFSFAKENGMKPSQAAVSFYSSRKEELDRRLANGVLKILKNEVLRENTKNIEMAKNRPHLSRSLIKKSNMLDVGSNELKRILFSFNERVKSDIIAQTQEDYNLSKKIKGESVIYE